MRLPPLLVTGYHIRTEPSALLLVDLNGGTYEMLRPYPGPIHATAETLYLVRHARLEKYDRNGLCWMRRVEDCLDAHSVTLLNKELVICSTGTNELIFLDDNGVERRRWSPDPSAEPDSWHLNSLHVSEGRLLVSCFGRHSLFRGWCGKLDGAGMVLDVATGQAVVDGLSGPHDPYRLPDGWLVNDSHLGRFVFVPDHGPREILWQGSPGFPRGLFVLPDHYVLGVSCPRRPDWPVGNARVLVIDRATRQVIRTVPIPYPEIGHVIAAPSPEVVESMRQERIRQLDCLLPPRTAITPEERIGGLTVSGPLQPIPNSPGVYHLTVKVSNRSKHCWSTQSDLPIYISYQVINSEGGILCPEGLRTPLPMPVGAGKALTCSIQVNLTICHHLPAAAAVRITLVQEKVAWWEPTEYWSPAAIPLPSEYVTPPPPAPRWSSRLRRVLSQ